jgi:hypothetical protein
MSKRNDKARWDDSPCAHRAPSRKYGDRERQEHDDFTELRTYDSETYSPKPAEWRRMHGNPSQAE